MNFNKLMLFCLQFGLASFFSCIVIGYIQFIKPEEFTTIMWAIVLSFLAIIIHKLDQILEWIELWNQEGEESNE